MSFKLLVVFAMISLAAASSEQDSLEGKILSKEGQLGPVELKKIVTELMENVYSKQSVVDYTRARMMIVVLHRISEVSKKICPKLEEYNAYADEWSESFSDYPNALKMMKYYQERQNELCQ